MNHPDQSARIVLRLSSARRQDQQERQGQINPPGNSGSAMRSAARCFLVCALPSSTLLNRDSAMPHSEELHNSGSLSQI